MKDTRKNTSPGSGALPWTPGEADAGIISRRQRADQWQGTWRKVRFLQLLIAVGLTIGVAVLFYRSVWGLAAGIFLIPWHLHQKKQEQKRKDLEEVSREFQSAMQMVSGALAAGYSLENAWRQAERDLVRLYGSDAPYCRELHAMNQRMRMNEPMEQLLMDSADYLGVEDIRNFAEIFSYAKRSGGNMTEIIRRTVVRMQEKTEILAEIKNAVTAQRAQQKLMNLMFPGILLFVTITSPEYAESFYHNFAGAVIMSGCLAGYLFLRRWSEKITEIEV